MKTVLAAIVAFSISVPALACIGEAQVLGKVREVRKTMTSCRVLLTSDSVVTVNPLCPLDHSDIEARGISVGMIDGHDCEYNAGDDISGILVDDGNFLFFER